MFTLNQNDFWVRFYVYLVAGYEHFFLKPNLVFLNCICYLKIQILYKNMNYLGHAKRNVKILSFKVVLKVCNSATMST